MRLRNGEHGYGLVTKLLHWLTVLLVVAQFVVGYTAADADAAADRSDDAADAFEESGEEDAEAGGEAAEERFEAEVERREEAADAAADTAVSDTLGDVLTGRAFTRGLDGLELHVLLGLSILGLAVARLVWRRVGGLPPWADHLSSGERTLEAWLEKLLLTLLLVVPGTGLLLAAGGVDLLPVHVAAQIALLGTVATHVGLVLSHTVVRRNAHLARML